MKRLLIAATVLAVATTTVAAEDLMVDTPYWGALSAEEQAEIADILKATKLIGDQDQLVSNPAEAAAAADLVGMEEFRIRLPKIKFKWPIKGICQAACDVAAATAAVACSGSAIAVAACLVAVEAGRQTCRRKC
jgi:hypothetical protein